MENTISGVQGQGETVEVPMVANSETSPKRGKRSMKQTGSLTPASELQIFEDALIRCQQSGIHVAKKSDIVNGKPCVVLVLVGVEDTGKHLALSDQFSNIC